jgi:hypothetical protein
MKTQPAPHCLGCQAPTQIAKDRPRVVEPFCDACREAISAMPPDDDVLTGRELGEFLANGEHARLSPARRRIWACVVEAEARKDHDVLDAHPWEYGEVMFWRTGAIPSLIRAYRAEIEGRAAA